MKYCPYCGCMLIDGVISFCTECGKELPTAKKQENTEPMLAQAREKLQNQRTGIENTEGQSGTLNMERERPDKKQRQCKRELRESLFLLRAKVVSKLRFGFDAIQKVGIFKKHVIASNQAVSSKEKSEPEILEESEMKQQLHQKSKDDYDGYYDDIIPLDEGSLSEGIDKKMIKKIAMLLGVVLFVIVLCVVVMYLL